MPEGRSSWGRSGFFDTIFQFEFLMVSYSTDHGLHYGVLKTEMLSLGPLRNELLPNCANFALKLLLGLFSTAKFLS